MTGNQLTYELIPDEGPQYGEPEPEIRRIYWVDIDGTVQPAESYLLTQNADTLSFQLEWDPTKVPQEDIAAAMSVNVALVPDWYSSLLPQFIRTRFGDYIIAGAVSKLALQQRKQWSNPQLGMMKLDQYEKGIATAIKERYLGRVANNLRVNLQRGWVV